MKKFATLLSVLVVLMGMTLPMPVFAGDSTSLGPLPAFPVVPTAAVGGGITMKRTYLNCLAGCTWAVPAGVTSVMVEVRGGSGGGGGASGNGGGGAGGTGGFSLMRLDVSPGQVYTITTGNYGEGGGAGGKASTAGGASSFTGPGGTVTAGGGAGGGRNPGTGGAGGAGMTVNGPAGGNGYKPASCVPHPGFTGGVSGVVYLESYFDIYDLQGGGMGGAYCPALGDGGIGAGGRVTIAWTQ